MWGLSRVVRNILMLGKLATMAFWDHFFLTTPGERKELRPAKRELYSSHPIDGYEVEEIDRPAAAIAVAKVRLCYRNDSWVASVRFSRQNGTAPVADWEPGDWKVVRYGADPFVDIGTSCD